MGRKLLGANLRIELVRGDPLRATTARSDGQPVEASAVATNERGAADGPLSFSPFSFYHLQLRRQRQCAHFARP